MLPYSLLAFFVLVLAVRAIIVFPVASNAPPALQQRQTDPSSILPSIYISHPGKCRTLYVSSRNYHCSPVIITVDGSSPPFSVEFIDAKKGAVKTVVGTGWDRGNHTWMPTKGHKEKLLLCVTDRAGGTTTAAAQEEQWKIETPDDDGKAGCRDTLEWKVGKAICWVIVGVTGVGLVISCMGFLHLMWCYRPSNTESVPAVPLTEFELYRPSTRWAFPGRPRWWC